MRGHLEDRARTSGGPRSSPAARAADDVCTSRGTIHGTKRFAEGKLAELLMELGRTDEVTTDGTLADLVQQ
jgi:hypothetical protein